MSGRLNVLRSVTIVSVSTYIEYALGLLVSVWIARTLGPADFGRYAFTVWLCGWLIVCSNHALTTSSTKFIAEAEGAGDESLAGHIAHRLDQLQHLSSLIVMALFLLVVAIMRPHEWLGALIPVTGLVVVATVAKANYAMLVAIGKGQEHFEPEALSIVGGGLISVALVATATWLHAGLLAFVAIFTIVCLLLNLFNRLAYRRYCRPYRAGPVPAGLAQRLRRHLGLTALLVLLSSCRAGAVEIFLLTSFASTTAVGFFTIAGTLTRGAVQLFSVGLTSTLLPFMAKSYGQHGKAHAAHFLGEATRFYWALGIAIAGLGLISAPEIVRLMYGNRYLEAVPAIQATLVLAGLLLIGNGIAAFQIVVDRQDDRVRIAVIALLANALLGIALIPRLGLTGAVLSYAGTRLTELGLALHYLRRASNQGLPWPAMARLFAVGLMATLAAWAMVAWLPGRYGFLPAAALFMAIYLPGSVLVRYWNAQDLQSLGALGGRMGRPGRWLARNLSRHAPPAAGSHP